MINLINKKCPNEKVFPTIYPFTIIDRELSSL